MTAVKDTLLPVKQPCVFKSDPSSVSGLSSGPLSRATSPDQLQQQIKAMRMKNPQFKDFLCAMHDNLQSMHQAAEVEKIENFMSIRKRGKDVCVNLMISKKRPVNV